VGEVGREGGGGIERVGRPGGERGGAREERVVD